VLAVEVGSGEKSAAYASLLRGLEEVRLLVSNDHEGMKAAVSGELIARARVATLHHALHAQRPLARDGFDCGRSGRGS
jgi:hypothetical protein